MRARREVTRTNGNFQSKPVVGHSDIYWVASLYSFARGATTSANRSNSASRFTCNPPEPTSFWHVQSLQYHLQVDLRARGTSIQRREYLVATKNISPFL